MPFECKKCGECCGPIPFTKRQWEVHKDKALREYTILPFDGNSVVPMTESCDCVFLTAENECAIYNTRPLVCRRQGLIPELPCFHSKDYKESPYPPMYAEMMESAKRMRGNRDAILL